MFITRQRAQSTKTMVWPSPVRGWMASGNLGSGQMDAAETLDNIFPTAQGARLRYGSVQHASLGSSVARFMSYVVPVGSQLWASTGSDIYEISSPVSPATTPVASLSGLTGGDWTTVQFTTSGGAFMVAVNGTDNGIYYDGTELQPLVDVAVTDLAYDALSAPFAVGEVVTGGTSGATATILAIAPISATAGALKLGPVTGTFVNDEALTDAATGAAVANGTTSSASSITITNVDTADLSQVWMFKERLFFIEKNTLSAWYLPVDSIGGAAVEFSFGSVFKRGGSLLFGATWSLDSGSGLDDKCIFVTTEGEIAVYEGSNPGSADTWGLVGVYQIGKPVDKHAAVQVGGDVILVTDDGMVPLSQALVKERTALMGSAITYPIEDAWRGAVSGRSASNVISATLWQSQSFLIVSTGTKYQSLDVSFVSNAQTGAWARYLGWDVQCGVVFQDNFFFGSGDGNVYQGETGGNDNGNAYTAYYVPKFSDFGDIGVKFANHVGLVSRSAAGFDFRAYVFSNYAVGEMTAPGAIAVPDDSSVWGAGVWGTSTWGGGGTLIGQEKWKSAGKQGFSLAPAIAITSNQVPSPQVEIIMTKVRYEVGSPL